MARVQVDMPTIDTKEAASLVVHHLAMAMALFQALPDNDNDIERDTLQAAIDEQFQGFSLEAEVANRFADVLCAKYDALKDED